MLQRLKVLGKGCFLSLSTLLFHLDLYSEQCGSVLYGKMNLTASHLRSAAANVVKLETVMIGSYSNIPINRNTVYIKYNGKWPAFV